MKRSTIAKCCIIIVFSIFAVFAIQLLVLLFLFTLDVSNMAVVICLLVNLSLITFLFLVSNKFGFLN